MRPREVKMREYSVMKELKHPTIVPLFDIEEEVSSKAMVIIIARKLLNVFTQVSIINL